MAHDRGFLTCGENVVIHESVHFDISDDLRIVGIGNKSRVKAFSVIHGGCSIGDNVRISPGVEIYPDCEIGNGSFIGHSCTLRPGTKIGNDCVIGHSTVFEGGSTIGDKSLIHAQCHITRGVKIGKGVFIAPFFVGANDRRMAHLRRDVLEDWFDPYTIGDYVRIGIGVTILPGVRIGNNAVIGAGALILKDVRPNSIVVGRNSQMEVGQVVEEERIHD
jgi:acetyltransferase-like isoleucine patch superfamily enzyme